MKIHVLPGDAYTETFAQTALDGEIVICRECLVEGDVRAENIEEFWQIRAAFIEKAYGETREKYFQNVRAEYEKLLNPAVTEINLWFEYELFCQTNLWFTLNFLRDAAAKIYLVAPVIRKDEEVWKGFGDLTAGEMEECFNARTRLNERELKLGTDLWTAYQKEDHAALETLALSDAPDFPYLREVCRAEVEKQTRTRDILREIQSNGATEFGEIFQQFSKAAGVYGFGDSQVKRFLTNQQ